MIPDLIGASLDDVHAAVASLRARLGEMPTKHQVAQRSGPVAVPVSSTFDRAMAGAAFALASELSALTELLDQHAAALKAAAATLSEADSSAATGVKEQDAALLSALILDNAVGDAQDRASRQRMTPTVTPGPAAPAAPVAPSADAADVAAATGSLA